MPHMIGLLQGLVGPVWYTFQEYTLVTYVSFLCCKASECA